MIKITDKTKCTGCTACASICPQKCISIVPDKEGFWYPNVNKKQCVNCELCVKTCPVLSEMGDARIQKSFAAYAKDEEIRRISSSGGIFSLIAGYVIDHNGVVFGAAFNSKMQVQHVCVDNKSDLAKLRTSKYVQSDIGDTYRQAQDYLESGKTVLFTGTPCQISGLKRYLNKEYDNLYAQDIFCHGVPSPKIWKQFLDYKSSAQGKPVRSVSFRSKVTGWKRFSVQYQYSDGESEVCSQEEDLYFKAFLDNLILRPSCYCCHFKGKNTSSDVTLADFWGVEKVFPDFCDDLGISLVTCNSAKGKMLFDSISSQTEYRVADYQQAIQGNAAATKSVYRKGSRDIIFKYNNNHNVGKTLKMFLGTHEKDVMKVQLLEDYEAVKSEKGRLFAALWRMKTLISRII